MLLRKEQGGSTVAGFTWENDGDVVDVTPDELAVELLAIKGGGYEHVLDTPEEPVKTEPAKGSAAKVAAAQAAEEAAAKALADAEVAAKAAG